MLMVCLAKSNHGGENVEAFVAVHAPSFCAIAAACCASALEGLANAEACANDAKSLRFVGAEQSSGLQFWPTA